jgi:hypothetical protein
MCYSVNIPQPIGKIMVKQSKKTELSTSETLLRRSFEPLLSPKDGKARLTFVGYQHSILEWKKDREKITKPVLKLVFSVLDKTHDSPANISITCDYRYNQNNRLGTTLKLMGFEVIETMEVVNADDEEYGAKVNSFDTASLFGFLRDSAGLVFKASLRNVTRTDKATGEKKEAKGLWEIDFTSLEPFIVKGEHKRDTDSDELGSAIESPKIDFEVDPD